MSQTMTNDENKSRPPKVSRMARVNERLAQKLEILAERNLTSLGSELNRAVRLLLEQESLWPDPPVQ